MHIRVLGSGAGGGFPQWNCNCENCAGLRANNPNLTARTQSSITVSSNGEDVPAEFYNSNPYNAFNMTMREPVKGTVKRGQYLTPTFAPDDYAAADLLLENPLDSTKAILADGKALYTRFCSHCHGAKGMGDGKVGKVYKGRGSHASQISPEERWKIAMYVKVLQQ